MAKRFTKVDADNRYYVDNVKHPVSIKGLRCYSKAIGKLGLIEDTLGVLKPIELANVLREYSEFLKGLAFSSEQIKKIEEDRDRVSIATLQLVLDTLKKAECTEAVDILNKAFEERQSE